MNDQVLSALREIREVHAEDFGELARRLLELLSKAMASVRVTLSLPQATEELIFGEGDERLLGPDAARLTVRIPCRSGVAVLGVVRASPFNARDDATRAELELLGGDIVLRLDHARSEREARRLGRQIELLHALSRAGTDAQRFPELADRAAQELLGAFAGAHVLVHVKVDDVLELVARRIVNGTGSAMATAPDWIVRFPLDAQSVMAIAARENRVVSRPVSEIPEPRRGVLEGFGVHHLLSVPLFFRDEVLGTISVAHREEMPWDQESIRMLEGAAAQLSIELVNIRALEAERHRAEDLGLINELGSLVAQHIELPAVLATAVNELARITKVSRVHMFLADEAKTVLNAVACSEEREANLVFPLTASAAVVHAYHAREPIIVDNAAIDPRTDKDLVRRLHTRSIMAVPLIARGEPIGSIGLVETQRARTFTKTEVARAVAVANIVSTAVTNAKMFDDLRRSYEALAHAQAELVMHERLAALGELSAVIAHEVRNPLAIIFNSLGALRRIDPLTSDAKLLLDIVGEEAARLNRIVGDLLDFVRPYTSHPRNVQVDAIVNGAVEAARRAAPDASVEVRANLHLPFNDVCLDGTMLQQALINLIVNAIQATPNGKTVLVRATAQIEEDDSNNNSNNTSSNKTTKLRFDVVDEGPGIDPADAARVFQPFFTTKATGTGLGLALVQRLTDTLGGNVEVTRAASGGAVFTLTVPLVRASDPGVA